MIDIRIRAACSLPLLLLLSCHTGTQTRQQRPAKAPLVELRENLEDSLPVLRNSAASDWDRVNSLRDWAYARVPRAACNASLLENNYGPRVYNESATQLLHRIDSGQGGFYCGGTAIFLADIYRLFGYRAFTYNMGEANTVFTHVVTLVMIQDGERRLASIEDAYYNYTLAWNGRPLGLLQLLSDLRSGQLVGVQILSGDTHCKPMVATRENAPKVREYLERFYHVGKVTKIADGREWFCHDFSIKTWDGMGDLDRWLQRKIGHPNFLYMFLFPISTSGETEANDLAAAANHVRQALLSNQN